MYVVYNNDHIHYLLKWIFFYIWEWRENVNLRQNHLWFLNISILAMAWAWSKCQTTNKLFPQKVAQACICPTFSNLPTSSLTGVRRKYITNTRLIFLNDEKSNLIFSFFTKINDIHSFKLIEWYNTNLNLLKTRRMNMWTNSQHSC